MGEYRQLPSIVRLTRPSRVDKARRLGYKAKQGFILYRVRVRRGNRKKPVPKGNTCGKPSNQGVTHIKPKRNLRVIAEGRVGNACRGLRILNSYWVNQDSTFKYYEVILIDPAHQAIREDPCIHWICNPSQKIVKLVELLPQDVLEEGLEEKVICTKKLDQAKGLLGEDVNLKVFLNLQSFFHE